MPSPESLTVNGSPQRRAFIPRVLGSPAAPRLRGARVAFGPPALLQYLLLSTKCAEEVRAARLGPGCVVISYSEHKSRYRLSPLGVLTPGFL